MDFTTSQRVAVAWKRRGVVPAGECRLKTRERVICGPGDKIGGQKNHEVRAGLRAPWETIATKTARAIRWRNLWRWRLWSSYNAPRDDGGRWPRKWGGRPRIYGGGRGDIIIVCAARQKLRGLIKATVASGGRLAGGVGVAKKRRRV